MQISRPKALTAAVSPLIGIAIGLIMLSACGGGSNPASTPIAATNNAPTIGWDKSPTAIIVRLDRQVQNEPQFNALNRLPNCTLYGNGHLVWVNNTSSGDQVLEALIDDTTIRSYLDFMIRQMRFYSLPDYAANELQPAGQVIVESISLNLSNTPRTVRSYEHWPNGEFSTILDKCTHLTTQPVLYLPTGAWLTVQPIANSTDTLLTWQPNQPFRLSDLAVSTSPLWISGQTLTALWNIQEQTSGQIQWSESNKTYKFILQVPGISRDAPTPPAITPTMPPLVVSAVPTRIPTVTSAPSATKPPTDTPQP